MLFNKNKKTIYIEGMMCNHCAKKVETTLLSINNITKVKVDLENKCAIITYTDKVNDEEIKEKISNLDYKVIDIKEG